MDSIVIQDACVLINLLASERFEDIGSGCGLRFAIASVVAQESMYLHPSGSGEREIIDLKPLIEKGILETLAAESENETQSSHKRKVVTVSFRFPEEFRTSAQNAI